MRIKVKNLIAFLLLILVIGLISFFNHFAKININVGIPMYITEFIIFCIFFLILSVGIIKGKIDYLKYPLSFYFFIFYLIFIFSLIRGWILYDDKIYILRQSALFYYSIFYFLIPYVLNSLVKIEKFLKVLFVVYIIVPFLWLFNPFFRDISFLSYFYSFIFIIFELFYLKFTTRLNQLLIWLTIFFQIVVFILAQARAAWVGAICAIIFVFYLINTRIISFSFVSKKIYVFGIFLGILFVFTALLNPSIIYKLSDEFSTIFFVSSEENNTSINTAKWRLYVWKDIINETLEQPILGLGFGKKFIPPTIKELDWGGSWRDPDKGFQDPHNSFLSIFHRTGLLGLFIFTLIILKFFKRHLRFLKVIEDEKIKILTISSLVSIVYILVTSFFMVVLEGPHLGISLWFLMGLTVAIEFSYQKT